MMHRAVALISSLIRSGHLIWLVVIAAAIAMSLLSPVFLTVDNVFDNILRQSAVIAIISIGMTFVIATRGFDLSVGPL